MSQLRKILVTSALPYANNSLHLGHLVEYVQTDVWVRFQRMRGHECWYVCASDAHGTPTMLRAEQQGVEPTELIAHVAAEHERDFATFRIGVDSYITTHAAENETLTHTVYQRLVDAGHISRSRVKQAYDGQKQMFLPDRYVRGTCPVCGKTDQYGDSCENCSATYSPLELVDPVSVISGARPTERESEHLFFKLSDFEADLREWVPGHVDAAMSNKLAEWFEIGLKDWDISRDAPYFGFRVPGEADKYFYVWFDAPIGYMASFKALCDRTGTDFDAFWAADSAAELYHFIGKDIVYFHTLFWPAMLAGAGYRRPTGVYVHGFLTVDGEKMSKRRGTFIMARTFAKHLDPDYLRYYFAGKLGPSANDIDLNFADFVARVNSDLVGKIVNIASRCAGFIHRLNGGRLAERLPDEALFAQFAEAAEPIAADYEARDFARAMRAIMALADRANQYIDDEKPWVRARNEHEHETVVGICTLGLNLFRNLMLFLKPVLPAVAERAEAFLACPPMQWRHAAEPLTGHVIARYEPLLRRVDPEAVAAIVEESKAPEPAAPVSADAGTPSGAAAGTAEPAAPSRGTSPDAAARTQPQSERIDIAAFARIDLRVARVIEAERVEGADKLLRLTLDLGDSRRVVFAGIRSAYDPATLPGRLVIAVANLEPRRMRFGTSEGMVLAAGEGGEEIFLLSPDAGAEPGMKVH